jgi:hypothetical protein
MLGNSWVAVQLVASQEGLISMELISFSPSPCVPHAHPCHPSCSDNPSNISGRVEIVKRVMKYNRHNSCTCIPQRNITKLVHMVGSFGQVIRTHTSYSGCPKASYCTFKWLESASRSPSISKLRSLCRKWRSSGWHYSRGLSHLTYLFLI